MNAIFKKEAEIEANKLGFEIGDEIQHRIEKSFKGVIIGFLYNYKDELFVDIKYNNNTCEDSYCINQWTKITCFNDKE